MKELTIREFRASIGHLDELSEQVGEITITKHGKPILRVLPMYSKRERPLHQDLRQKMPRLKVSSTQHIRDDRDDR
jgi:prevent-host-death family protein